MFRFKSISLLFTQLRAPPLTEYLKQQHFTSIVILLYTFFAYSNNCSLGLYSSDLRTTIILFSRSVSLHKTDWILSEQRVFTQDWPISYWVSLVVFTNDWLNFNWITVVCSVLPFISQQSDECTCMRMSFQNLYKCKQVVYCVFCLCSSWQSCCCLFISLSP